MRFQIGRDFFWIQIRPIGGPTVYIPKSAFVSNFSMIVKGQEYVAKVETKEKAQETFDNSDDISGLVQNQATSDFKDTEHVSKSNCSIYSR